MGRRQDSPSRGEFNENSDWPNFPGFAVWWRRAGALGLSWREWLVTRVFERLAWVHPGSISLNFTRGWVTIYGNLTPPNHP